MLFVIKTWIHPAQWEAPATGRENRRRGGGCTNRKQGLPQAENDFASAGGAVSDTQKPPAAQRQGKKDFESSKRLPILFVSVYYVGTSSQTLIIPAFLEPVKENGCSGVLTMGKGALFRQYRTIPSGGARRKIFCDMNQKAQPILGGLASIFGK